MRLSSPQLLGGSWYQKNSNVGPTPTDRIELINTKSPGRSKSKSKDYEEDILNGSQIRLLTAYDAIAENRNVEVYNSADEACDPIRIKMLKRVDVTSSSYLMENQKRLLKHLIHSLRQGGEEFDKLRIGDLLANDKPLSAEGKVIGEEFDKISTCFEQMLKQNFEDVKEIPAPE